MKKVTLIVVSLLCVCLCYVLTGCQVVIPKGRVLTKATVVSKEQKDVDSSIIPVDSGKLVTAIVDPESEEYWVTLESNGIEQSYQDKSLYEKYEVGNKIPVYLYTCFDTNSGSEKQEIFLIK